MENATEAIKTAGAVLLFVLALSIIILYFGKVRRTSDALLNYRDRELLYIDGEYYYKGGGLERNVGLETIIPAVTRAYLENYKIVFNGLEKPLYLNEDHVKKYVLDLESNNDRTKDEQTGKPVVKDVIFGDDEAKEEFLCGILYGEFRDRTNFESKFNIYLDDCKPLYKQLVEKTNLKVKEYLGVYYQTDSENNPNANKTEKRIITYDIQ